MLDDRCPNCGHHRPYLMSRTATENVLSWNVIAWVVVAVLGLLIFTAGA